MRSSWASVPRVAYTGAGVADGEDDHASSERRTRHERPSARTRASTCGEALGDLRRAARRSRVPSLAGRRCIRAASSRPASAPETAVPRSPATGRHDHAEGPVNHRARDPNRADQPRQLLAHLVATPYWFVASPECRRRTEIERRRPRRDRSRPPTAARGSAPTRRGAGAAPDGPRRPRRGWRRGARAALSALGCAILYRSGSTCRPLTSTS